MKKPTLFTMIAGRLAIFLTLILVTSGLMAWWTFHQLDTDEKTFAFDNGGFYVQGEVVGIPVFSVATMFFVGLIVATQVWKWYQLEDRKVI